MSGCGVLSNFRIDWKRRLFSRWLSLMPEVKSKQSNHHEGPSSIPGRITTGLTLHVICNLHRPVGDSGSDTYDLLPAWFTYSVRRAAPGTPKLNPVFLFSTSANWSPHYKEIWTPRVRVWRERHKRDVLRGQGGSGWVYSWESSWAVGPRGSVGCGTRSITHWGRGLCHLCN